MDTKKYFAPGDKVRIKHGIEYRPIMIVERKVTSLVKGYQPVLLGIKCFWFSTDLRLQTGLFSTKDLEHIE